MIAAMIAAAPFFVFFVATSVVWLVLTIGMPIAAIPRMIRIRRAKPAFEDETTAKVREVLSDVGLTDQVIARQVTGWVAALGSAVSEHEISQQLD